MKRPLLYALYFLLGLSIIGHPISIMAQKGNPDRQYLLISEIGALFGIIALLTAGASFALDTFWQGDRSFAP